jgi:hypothetical protein
MYDFIGTAGNTPSRLWMGQCEGELYHLLVWNVKANGFTDLASIPRIISLVVPTYDRFDRVAFKLLDEHSTCPYNSILPYG